MEMHAGKKKAEIVSKMSILITIVYGVSLIPVLVMGMYNYPSADDYGFGAYSHIAWHNTHNIFQALGGAFKTVYERYFGWQGTFSSIFLMALQPAVWSEKAYFLSTWIIVLVLSASTLFLMHVILIRLCKVDKMIWLGLSSLVLLFDVQCMIDKTQGLYWFNGAAHYIIARGLAIILIAYILLSLFDGKNRYIGTMLLAFWIGGSNLLTGLITLILLFAGMAIYGVLKDFKKMRVLLFPFISLSLAFILNVIAPGNSVRAAGVEHTFGPIKSIFLSFYYCIDYFTKEWASWEWMGFIIMAFPFVWITAKRVCENTEYKFQLPMIVIGIGYCILSAMFTPLLFAEGNPGTGRTFNIIFMDGILWLLLDLFYISGWIIRKYNPASVPEKDTQKTLTVYWFVTAAVIVVFSAFYVKVDENRYTATSAVRAIVSGEAKTYARECCEQIDAYKAAEGNLSQEVAVYQITTKPYLTFYEDVEPEKDNWKNNLVTRFYQIGSLNVKKR